MPSIESLVADINHVLQTGEGYTEEVAEWVSEDVRKSLLRQMKKREDKGSLRLSGLGTKCERKLWYTVNKATHREKLTASTLNKFIFGDLTESHIIGLCMAAGHKVEGMQDQLNVEGVLGHRDCVIDGMLIDVKSASSFSFRKFKEGKLREEDPFGYISQLSSYLYGSQDDPLVTEKNKAGFLAFDKQFGHIALDIYDLSPEVKTKKAEVENCKSVVKMSKPPAREYEPEPDGKSGNTKLCTQCSYCDFKKICWPDMRTFIYKGGPRYLINVAREPRDVFEL